MTPSSTSNDRHAPTNRVDVVSSLIEKSDFAGLRAFVASTAFEEPEIARLRRVLYTKVVRTDISDIDALYACRQILPVSPLLALRMASALNERGRVHEIIDDLSQVIAELSHRHKILPFYLQAAREAGKTDQALERFATFPDDPFFAVAMDGLLIELGRVEEADQRAASFLKQHPGAVSLVLAYASRLFQRQDINAASDVYRSAIQDQPENLTIVQRFQGMLFSARKNDQAVAVLRTAVDRCPRVEFARVMLINGLLRVGALEEARRAKDAAILALGETPLLQAASAMLLAADGSLDEACAVFDAAARRAVTPEEKRNIARRQAPVLVRRETRRILATIPTPTPIKGVAAMMTLGSPLSLVWKALAAHAMRKRGFVTLALDSSGALGLPATGDPDIDSFDGILDLSQTRLRGEPENRGLRHQWQIDPANRIISTGEFNFFQPIFERLSTILRRYRVDFDHPIVGEATDDLIRRADAALAVCERMEKTLGRRGVPVRILGSMSHYVPSAVFKIYCRDRGRHWGMEYVSFLAGYQHYYNNLGNKLCTALSVANLTRRPELRMPCHASEQRFEAWLAKGQDVEAVKREIDAVIDFDRARVVPSPEADAVMRRIQTHRARGGKVVCLFGKIMYDICIDEEGGPAHVDMVDWLNHSIEAVRGADDVLLLIKPHPNEINPKIASPTEFFTDVIAGEVPHNVVVLEHRWFNVRELLPVIDLGLLWHGTTTLELLAKGLPVAVAATWGIKDHPVPVIAPTSRDDYAEIVRHPGRYSVSRDARIRAAMLLKYLASDEVIIPHNYAYMPVFGGNAEQPIHWYADKVEHYLAHGDPFVEQIADRCISG